MPIPDPPREEAGTRARIRRIDAPSHPADLARSQAQLEGETVFLVDSGEDDAVYLVAGATVRSLPRGDGGNELLDRARRGAAAWRRQRTRMLRRIELPRRLLAFAEELGQGRSREDILRAVTGHTAAIVGGYRAIVFVPAAGGGRLEPFDGKDGDPNVWLEPDPTRDWAGTVHPEEAEAGTGAPFTGLAPLFTEESAARLACVPLGREAVLVLVERRDDRQFDANDWELLEAVARQAVTGLERVSLFEQVRDLSLTDPLTGLANRRQLAVVMERSLAAARRGKGLAVVMVDLDHFKQINDELGHTAGDRALRTVASVLQDEARGADLVVRYGGDEFLVVLPGGTREGASAFLERVEARLAGEVAFTAGIAEYEPSADSLEALVQNADRDLYRRRARAGRSARSESETSEARR